MGAAKKGIGTGTKSSKLGKASTKPLLKNAAKRATAKKSKFRRADTKSINGARAKALTARVDQMLWSANSENINVFIKGGIRWRGIGVGSQRLHDVWLWVRNDVSHIRVVRSQRPQ